MAILHTGHVYGIVFPFQCHDVRYQVALHAAHTVIIFPPQTAVDLRSHCFSYNTSDLLVIAKVLHEIVAP